MSALYIDCLSRPNNLWLAGSEVNLQVTEGEGNDTNCPYYGNLGYLTEHGPMQNGKNEDDSFDTVRALKGSARFTSRSRTATRHATLNNLK